MPRLSDLDLDTSQHGILDPKFKARWIDELVNGGLSQGVGLLNNLDRDTYCCLGVACELAVEDGITDAVVIIQDEATDGAVSYGAPKSSYVLLPEEVVEWYGFPDIDPIVTTDGHTLSSLNDEGYTFKQLAKIIDKCL